MSKPKHRWEKPTPSTKHELPCSFGQLKPWMKNLYQKRREYLIVMHGWTTKDADEEALNFLAHEIYLDNERRWNKAAQMPLFAPGGEQKTGMVDTKKGRAA